jgi:hypothetical protein
MGEPLYQMQPPTGYTTTADHWMNSAALVDRLNFSLQFSDSKLNGIKFDAPHLLATGLLESPTTTVSMRAGHTQSIALTSSEKESGEDQALALMENMLLDGQVSDKTNAVIRKELSAPPAIPPPPAETTEVHTGTYNAAAIPVAPPTDPTQVLNTMTALILGSPEFQMH